jgi:hypothetical protein
MALPPALLLCAAHVPELRVHRGLDLMYDNHFFAAENGVPITEKPAADAVKPVVAAAGKPRDHPVTVKKEDPNQMVRPPPALPLAWVAR